MLARVGRAPAALDTAYAPFLADLWKAQDGAAARLTSGRTELAPDEAARLSTLMTAACVRLGAPDEFVYDGMPCELIILRPQEPVMRIALNMMGVPAGQQDHPYVQLLRLLLELAERTAAGSSAVAGATDAWGTIEIRRV